MKNQSNNVYDNKDNANNYIEFGEMFFLSVRKIHERCYNRNERKQWVHEECFADVS